MQSAVKRREVALSLSRMHVVYAFQVATCQRNHWSKHKKTSEKCVANYGLRNEALFTDKPIEASQGRWLDMFIDP